MADELLEVPLFPLSLVLFPGMALPLHIFEPRYRRMTADCLDTNLPIGIVMALPESMPGNEVPAQVGTFARIVDYERLPDGRYNLLAAGTERFEVVELRHDKPYLRAVVRPIRDLPIENRDELEALTREARATLDDYLHVVLTLLGTEDRPIEVPNDPCDLSYLMATCLGCDDPDKQRLLEMRSVAERLSTGIELLRNEIGNLAAQADTGAPPPPDGDRSRLN